MVKMHKHSHETETKVVIKKDDAPKRVGPAIDWKRKVLASPADILRESKNVAEAFGPVLGFILIVTAILARAGVSTAGLIVLMNGVSRVL